MGKTFSWKLFDIWFMVLVLSPFIYNVGHVLWLGVPDVINSGDGALLEMSTRSLLSRNILLGPYSRFLFFHPGPLYFFLRYPFYMVLGQRNSSFLVVTCLISTVSLLGGWFVVRKFTDKFTSLLFAAVFSGFLMNTDKVLWLSEWNPHIIMFPIMLFAVTMAAVASGRIKYLYPAVFAGSFVAQTHISGIPVLVALGIAALMCSVYPWIIVSAKRKNSSGAWKHMLASFALLLLLWAPPMYEQIRNGDHGNMSQIREFFEETNSDQNLETALAPWSNTLTDFEMGKFARYLRSNGLSDSASITVIALRVLLLATGFGLLRRKGKYAFLGTMNLLCLFMHGITFYSVSQVRGELNPYLIEWMVIVAPLSVFTILATVVTLIRQNKKDSVVFSWTGWLMAVFVVYASISLVIDVRGYFRPGLDPSWENELAVQELSPHIMALMDQEPEAFYVLKLQSQERWAVMFGLMNYLEKKGYPVCMEDNVWFTSTLPPDSADTRILHLGTLNAIGERNPGLFARYGDIGVILQRVTF